MILKKIVIGLFVGFFFNGCGPSVTLLGPVSTLAYTGNITQAGLSYGSSKAVKKFTGKSTTENIKNFIDKQKNTIVKKEKEENYEEFFTLVKENIEKTSKVLNLANQ
jgi:prolyl-tRNA synthetase